MVFDLSLFLLICCIVKMELNTGIQVIATEYPVPKTALTLKSFYNPYYWHLCENMKNIYSRNSLCIK